MIEPTQQAWKDYANRLRAHWVAAARSHPEPFGWWTDQEYEAAVQKWYEDHYLTEPMAPGQEYANNH